MNETNSPAPRSTDASTHGRVTRSTVVTAALLLGLGFMLLGRLAPELAAAVAGRAWAAVLVLPFLLAIMQAARLWRTTGHVPRNVAVWVVIAAIMAGTGIERLTGL